MCGIAGMIGDGWTSAQFDWLFNAIQHRGPDCSGVFASSNLQLGMNRLCIRGENTRLPVRRPENITAFNGQIYGIYDSRNALTRVSAGIEQEVAVFDAYTASNINGMYSFARTSADGANLLLSTDSQFIKPLFYCTTDKGIAFCSEFTPLARLSGRNSLDLKALAELFTYGWYLSDQSYLKSLRLVNREDIIINSGEIFVLAKQRNFKQLEFQDSLIKIRQSVSESVKHCLEGNGPFGLALSGGLDSSILAWEINNAGFEDLVTISVVIPETGDGVQTLDELKLPPGGAWKKWKHYTVAINDERNFSDSFKSSTIMFGQPTNMSSLPLFQLIAETAADHGVRVLLSGEGVDEFFGGYGSYAKVRSRQAIQDYYRHPPRERLVRRLFGHKIIDLIQQQFGQMYCGCTDLRLIERELRLTRLLLRTDVCLMSQSIEGRVPFLHNRIPDIALSIPWEEHVAGPGKFMMRKAYKDDLYISFAKNKKRFKISDSTLLKYLANKRFKDRIAIASGTIFGEPVIQDCLEILSSEDGFDADIFCLLMSLSFLVEEGLIE